jgi:hypothetical protein
LIDFGYPTFGRVEPEFEPALDEALDGGHHPFTCPLTFY